MLGLFPFHRTLPPAKRPAVWLDVDGIVEGVGPFNFHDLVAKTVGFMASEVHVPGYKHHTQTCGMRHFF